MVGSGGSVMREGVGPEEAAVTRHVTGWSFAGEEVGDVQGRAGGWGTWGA